MFNQESLWKLLKNKTPKLQIQTFLAPSILGKIP